MKESKNPATAKAGSELAAMALLGLAVGWMAGLSASPVLQTILASVLSVAAPLLAALIGIKLQPEKTAEAPDLPKEAVVDSDVTQTAAIVYAEDKGQKAVDTLERIKITAWPLTCFVLFLAIGSSCGLLARTNELLGTRPQWTKDRWLISVSAVQPRAAANPTNAPTSSHDAEKSKDPCSKDLDDVCVVHRMFDNVYPPANSEAKDKPEAATAGAQASTKVGKDGKQELQLSINTHAGALVDNAGSGNKNVCPDLKGLSVTPGNTADINQALRQLGAPTCKSLDTPEGVEGCKKTIVTACPK